MEIRRFVLLIAFIVPAVLAYLLSGFAADIQAFGAAATEADAIVVLTGGKGRTEEGLRLLRRGAAELLILSGVNRDADLDSIYHASSLTDAERAAILLEKRSESTYGNAREVSGIFTARGFDSMILITSGYHMKRALRTFNRIIPASVAIQPYAVTTPNFSADAWWSGRSLGIVTVEFIKYCYYELRYGTPLA